MKVREAAGTVEYLAPQDDTTTKAMDLAPLYLCTRAFGLPIEQKLSCLRQERFNACGEYRYIMFIKYAAVQLQQLGLKRQLEPPEEAVREKGKWESGMKVGEAKRIVESMKEQIVQAVNSFKEKEFDIGVEERQVFGLFQDLRNQKRPRGLSLSQCNSNHGISLPQ